MFVPTRRLALLAAVLAFAWLVYPGPDLAVLSSVAALSALVLLLGLADALAAPRLRRLQVSREHPPVVVVDQEATIRWELRSEARRSVRVSVADELVPSLRARTRRFSVRVPAGGSASVSTSMAPLRRGRFELRTLSIRVEGPLGLGSRQRRVPLRTTLRVYPPFRSRDEAELKIRRARVLEVGVRTARGLGGGTEFEQLREYGPDDEFRRIDWTASARSGRTIVRTYRAERNQSVLVMLDNGRTMAGRVEGVPRVEHAMDAVMMLATVATRLGDRCGLVAFDREVRSVVVPSRSPSQVARMTEVMFDLEPELAESDHSAAFAEVAARFRRRSMLVLLTDLQDDAVQESLLPALTLLTRTHLVVVAAVRDPQLERWAEHGVDDDPDLDADAAAHRKAAAMAALAQRRRTVVRLRARGATVVDAAPGRLSGELADTYLAVKGSGRL